MEHNIAFQVLPDQMANKKYSLLVRNYALGQFRVQITDVSNGTGQNGAPPGHGDIVQEMCTYKREKALGVIADLGTSEDPVATALTYVRPHNCEFKGGRIRLDNAPEVWPGCGGMDVVPAE